MGERHLLTAEETGIGPPADAVSQPPLLAWVDHTTTPGAIMRPTRILLVPVVLALATACADDSSSSRSTATGNQSPAAATATAPTSETYDPQPYCQTTRLLEKAGEQAFADLGRNATPAAYEAAERSFVLDNADLLDELVATAPADLTDDVETFLAAMRQRGGLEDSGVTQRKSTQAENTMLAFEEQHC